jgi:tetratricopeptide (TPR) repeat protein
VEAHQNYLQGRFFGYRHSEEDEVRALAAFQRAVELDPNFALAWVGLGSTHAWFSAFSTTVGRTGFEQHLAAAREAVARSLALEPNLAEGLLTRANLKLNFDFDVKAAAEDLKKALALAPSNPDVLIVAGNLEIARGDLNRGTEFYKRAVALDPVNGQARSFLAFNLVISGRFEEARAEYPRIVELNPAIPWAHAGLGLCYLLQGKFEEAVAAAQGDAGEWAKLLVVSCARWAQKKIPESDAALAELKKMGDTAAYQVAEVYAYRGEKDQAFDWLERARQQRDPGLAALRKDPLVRNLQGDARWNEFLHKSGLADEQVN